MSMFLCRLVPELEMHDISLLEAVDYPLVENQQNRLYLMEEAKAQSNLEIFLWL